MRVSSNWDDIFLGRGIGKIIERDISEAKSSIKIISPYLTPSYVENILKLSKKGIKITLITANDIETDNSGDYSDLSHTDLIKQKRFTDNDAMEERNTGMQYSGAAFFFLFIALFVLSESWILICILMLINFLIFYHYKNIRIYTYEYYSPIRLKVIPDEYYVRDNLDENTKGVHLIHSKVYVIDDKVAYVGSINFTHKAFKSNYETLVRIKSSNTVKEISKEVDRLYFDKDVYSIDLNSWGKQIYDEPPN